MTSVLEEKDAIREMFASYCFYTDTGQFEKSANQFTEDGEWDGGPIGHERGRANILGFFKRGVETSTRLRHSVSNISITVDGNQASAISYVQVLGIDQPTPSVLFSGIYLDKLVKHNGRWLFRQRKVRTNFADAGEL